MATYVNHVIFLLIVTTFFVPRTLGVMFNMVDIGPENQKDILTDGVETYVSTDGIELTTRNHTRADRATYVDLLHLWDAASGQLADFTTHFSVSIDSKNGSDRFSFFLAHNGSLVNASEGMGHRPIHGTEAQLLPFVAVEFDTHYLNSNSNGDPVDGRDRGPLLDHVGINVNSYVDFEKWGGNVSYGNQYFVTIQYDSGSQNLSVFYRGTIVVNQFDLHHTVDLRNVLPEWVVFGFSSSSSSGGQFHRNSVQSWFFNSTVLHMDNNRLKKKEKTKTVYIVTVSLVLLLLIFVIGGFLKFICLRKKTGANDQTIDQNPDGGGSNSWEPRRFTFEELSKATDGFNPNRMLGRGGFGVVYRANLTTGDVAVKKIRGTFEQGIREYEAEVKTVGGACHKHLVRVVGWCNERGKELLVVYEFMENLSLDVHLFDSSRESLRWNVRYNIAKGLAKAVRYLHKEFVEPCMHRDIKAGNVLLDSNFEAKLGDFGLVKLLDHDTSQELMSCLAGTPGYIDPECFQNHRFSQSSDVYSYGMVVLEIVTGRRCTGFINPDQEDQTTGLAEWVRNKYTNGNIREIVDQRLNNDFDVLQMEGLVALGLWCASRDSKQRPADMEVVAYILDGSSEQSFSLIPKFEGTGQRSSLETDGTLLVPNYPPSYLHSAWMFVSPIIAQIFTRQPNHPLTVVS